MNSNNSDALYLALDLGGTNIKSALVRSDGEILEKSSLPTGAEGNREEILQNITQAIQAVHRPGIRGIGMGSPGRVDPRLGRVDFQENIPALKNVNLIEEVHGRFSEPIFIDNDANNAARGQYLFGAGQGASSLLGVTLGTGVGGGLIFEGKVYGGLNNYGGEIGHVTYIPDGLECNCGKRGCLEAYAAAPALRRRAGSIRKRNIKSRLNELPAGEPEAEDICRLAAEGDESAKLIVQEAGKALGVVLGNTMNLLNLDRIVIGGGLSAAGEVLLNPIRFYAARHALPAAFADCEITTDVLGNDAALLGCAALVIERLGG